MGNVKHFEKNFSPDISNHPRLSEFQRLVYPVISRRAEGLSLGININPDKTCSFNCVYCQVNREKKVSGLYAGIPQIVEELENWLIEYKQGGNRYQGFPLKDISIAGDGEPTTVKILPDLLKKITEKKKEYGLNSCKTVLFTNGTMIDRPDIQKELPRFFNNNGEIWFKLDFWDETSIKKINRTEIPAEKLINKLIIIGKKYPLVLQSCFFSWNKERFNEDIYSGYIELIQYILKKGVKIKLIQAYTLARKPADLRAVPWSDNDMDRLYTYFKDKLTVSIKITYQNGI